MSFKTEIDKDIFLSKNQIDPLMKSVKMVSVREEQCFCAQKSSKELVDQENKEEIATSPTGSCYYGNSLFMSPQTRCSEHLLCVS